MKKYILIAFAVCSFFFGCKKSNEITNKTYTINGIVQKGPFTKGTSITISELRSDLSQTGRNFITTIIDDKGSFNIPNIELSSSYIYVAANGYFFNENSGALSNSVISLNAIVDLQSNQNININIITTIESERIKTLVQSGLSLAKAKKQALNEIFKVFNYSTSSSNNSETLDITQTGNSNSALLAISSIILGTHTEAELTELISGITTDLKTDGTLDDTNLQSDLFNEAKLLNKETIITNLKKRYTDLGLNITANNFDKYIDTFVVNSKYIFTKEIKYPTMVNTLLNVLSDTLTQIIAGTKYCIAANLPKGTTLKVVYKPSNGFSSNGIGIFSMENNGWIINSSLADSTNITSTGTNQIISISFMTGPPTSVDFLMYENNSTTPTKIKTLKSY